MQTSTAAIPAPLTPKELGRRGEDLAAEYLSGRGMAIISRNWRSRFGEIDIIARDGEALVFVEVKTRSGDLFGVPAAAVTPEKLRRIRRLAAEWIATTSPAYAEVLRVDVVAVLVTGVAVQIEHLQGVG